MEPTRTVAVVGGGASGALSALHLARTAEDRTHVFVVEPSANIGFGVAYGTREWSHLLNVPAECLSAYPDDPHHFTRWAAGHSEPNGTSYLPRRIYGEYLNQMISGTRGGIEHVRSRVVDIVPEAGGLDVYLSDGGIRRSDRVVLAVGSPAPSWPAGLEPGDARWISDPWQADWLAGLDRDRPVVLLGSGLTAVDAALSLRAAGHRQIVAVSRHGWLPAAHPETPRSPTPLPVAAPPPGASVRELVRWVRHAASPSGDWIGAIDSLRPSVDPLWESLTEAEQGRFLRLCLRRWEVLRHRMAPQVAARIQGMQAGGELTVVAGRIRSAVTSGDEITLVLDDRRLSTAAVINCTGPSLDVRSSRHPLVRTLLATGVARPGPLALGLDTDEDGHLPGTDQRIAVVGPLRRGRVWETTAIPEIRQQSWALARHLAAGELFRRPD